MCLDSITKTDIKKTSGVGYKIMKKNRNGGFNFEYYPRSKSLKLGQTAFSKNNKVISENGSLIYESGFHVFTSFKAAKNWKAEEGWIGRDCVIVKVSYDKAHTLGKQLGYNCVVAKQITLLKEIK